jgi:hypothetical protein
MGENYGDTVVTFLERIDATTLYVAVEILGTESGTDSYTSRTGPTRGPGKVAREVRRREMAAGEHTGRAGRPPLIGNRVPLIA